MEALQAQVQIKGALGGLGAAKVPHQLGGALGDKGPLPAKLLGIGDAVVALVRRGEPRELVGVGHPVKPAAVHNGAAHRHTVAVHILGGGVSHDVRPPLEGPAVHRRCKGVVHDQRHAVAVGGPGEFLDIQHRQGRVCDGLAEDRLGIGPEGGVQLRLRAVRGHKGGLDPHPGHGDGDQVEGAAVDAGGGHDMVSAGGQVEQGEEVSRLTGGGQHGRRAPLQGADLGGHGVTGGILEPGVKIAAGLQVKELAHVLAGGVLEGGGLDDGDLAGLAAAGGVAPLDTGSLDPIVTHMRSPFNCLERKKQPSSQRMFFETKAVLASAVPLKLRRPHGPTPLSESSNSSALTRRTRETLRRGLSNLRLRSHRTLGTFLTGSHHPPAL